MNVSGNLPVGIFEITHAQCAHFWRKLDSNPNPNITKSHRLTNCTRRATSWFS